jgi:hypothetical protein
MGDMGGMGGMGLKDTTEGFSEICENSRKSLVEKFIVQYSGSRQLPQLSIPLRIEIPARRSQKTPPRV